MIDYEQFTLKISMGNAKMRRLVHVADALQIVVDKLTSGHDFGIIMDINGNSVGSFEMT